MLNFPLPFEPFAGVGSPAMALCRLPLAGVSVPALLEEARRKRCSMEVLFFLEEAGGTGSAVSMPGDELGRVGELATLEVVKV